MSEAKGKKLKKFDKLFLELQSDDEQKFKKALDTLASEGNLYIIEPIAKIMFAEQNRDRKAKYAEFFSNISQSEAIEALIVTIQNEENQKNQADLLNTIWNSRMDFSEFLPEFVDLAIDGDFEITMECHTIIEHMDGPFDEAQVLECQLLLGAYKDVPNRSPEKDMLIADIVAKLGDIDAAIDG